MYESIVVTKVAELSKISKAPPNISQIYYKIVCIDVTKYRQY